MFVAHSYGGLVVKQVGGKVAHAIALLILLAHKAMAQATPRHLDIRESTKAIIFLGCPHFGSDFAKWGVVAAQLLIPLGSNPIMLQGLESGSLILHDLHRIFIESSLDTKVVNFFEEREVRILRVGPFEWKKLVSRKIWSVQLTVLTDLPSLVCHRAVRHMVRSHCRKPGSACRSLQSQQI
jgi:hypothetical protein